MTHSKKSFIEKPRLDGGRSPKDCDTRTPIKQKNKEFIRPSILDKVSQAS